MKTTVTSLSRPAFAFAAALLIATAALPTVGANAQQTATAPVGTPGADGKAKLSDAEANYLRGVAKSNLTELAISFLAIEKGASDGVKKNADEMIDNHIKSMKELLELASRHDLFIPLAVDNEMVKGLMEQSGSAFDPAYAAAAQKINQDAIGQLEPLMSQFTDEKVKSFAKDDLADDKKHLKEAQELAGKLVQK